MEQKSVDKKVTAAAAGVDVCSAPEVPALLEEAGEGVVVVVAAESSSSLAGSELSLLSLSGARDGGSDELNGPVPPAPVTSPRPPVCN